MSGWRVRDYEPADLRMLRVSGLWIELISRLQGVIGTWQVTL